MPSWVTTGGRIRWSPGAPWHGASFLRAATTAAGPGGSVRIVAVPHDDLESRVTSLEHEVIRLRETQLELRETQLEQGRELVGLQQEMRAGFATLSTGMV
jgi:hypothetical protein